MSAFSDYKVADISLADWGRREVAIAEGEMPGLMAWRAGFGSFRPPGGARCAGSGASSSASTTEGMPDSR